MMAGRGGYHGKVVGDGGVGGCGVGVRVRDESGKNMGDLVRLW